MDITTLDPFVACAFIYSMATTIALGLAFKRLQEQGEIIQSISSDTSAKVLAVMSPVVVEIKKLKTIVGVE